MTQIKNENLQQNKGIKLLKDRFFLNPEWSNIDQAMQLLKSALVSLGQLQGKSPIYPDNIGIPKISDIIDQSVIPDNLAANPEIKLKELPYMVQRTVKSGNPYMVKNLIPTVSLPALSAYFAISTFMGNGVTGEDSGQTLLAEIACVSAISKLAGISPKKSAGVFTFGGTGTNMYGIKLGLAKILPNHSMEGIKDNVAIIESYPSHYSHKTAADWLGIGQNNCIKVKSNLDQTTNLKELERTCDEILSSDKKLVCINAVGGTTSGLGIDNIKDIYEMRKRLIKRHNLDYTPHIHMDSVLGWAYLNFINYDFKQNKLKFSKAAVLQIKKILERIKTIKYADSFGVDFHKTGYVAYNSSLIIVKNKKDLMKLQRDVNEMTPLFHDDEAYNPGKYTLETSRSSANILATWIALETFGQEGYQILLGNAIENGIKFKSLFDKHIKDGFFVANQQCIGPDVFVRCYPPDIDAKINYYKELSDSVLLEKNTEYISQFFKWLDKKMPLKPNGFAISKSSAAIYTNTGVPMVALRIYPLSPYITYETDQILVDRIVQAKHKFDKIYKK
jgi:glutamate/tyrosine decarboxylase-like PLP-dependent enzyme